MNKKLTIFSMMLLALFSCKETKETIDPIADYATGKTQIEKKNKATDALQKANEQHNKQLEEAVKENP